MGHGCSDSAGVESVSEHVEWTVTYRIDGRLQKGSSQDQRFTDFDYEAYVERTMVFSHLFNEHLKGEKLVSTPCSLLEATLFYTYTNTHTMHTSMVGFSFSLMPQECVDK